MYLFQLNIFSTKHTQIHSFINMYISFCDDTIIKNTTKTPPFPPYFISTMSMKPFLAQDSESPKPTSHHCRLWFWQVPLENPHIYPPFASVLDTTAQFDRTQIYDILVRARALFISITHT